MRKEEGEGGGRGDRVVVGWGKKERTAKGEKAEEGEGEGEREEKERYYIYILYIKHAGDSWMTTDI